jgi:hypothetical protein
MSQRTIVEINHDFAYLNEAEFELFAKRFRAAIGSGSADSWEPLERYGFRRVVQCHHSDERKVVTKHQEFKL